MKIKVIEVKKDIEWLKEEVLELKNNGNVEANQTETEREIGRLQKWAWNNCVDRVYELINQLDEPEVNSQIDKLANFIMSEVEGEPSQSQGAVDTAIRIIKSYQNQDRTDDGQGSIGGASSRYSQTKN